MNQDQTRNHKEDPGPGPIRRTQDPLGGPRTRTHKEDPGPGPIRRTQDPLGGPRTRTHKEGPGPLKKTYWSVLYAHVMCAHVVMGLLYPFVLVKELIQFASAFKLFSCIYRTFKSLHGRFYCPISIISGPLRCKH